MKNWKAIHEETCTWARWIALYEAINMIADKCEEKNIDFETVTLDPLEIKDYVESTQDLITRKLLSQEYNIDICYSEENEKVKSDEYQFV
jgi:hypothetical protein